MANKVLLKKSSVVGKVPTTSDLSYGELALNYADGKLYFKDSSNSIKSFTEDSSVVTLSGTQTLSNKTLSSPQVTGNLVATGDLKGNYLHATNSSGDEGGEILLYKPQTNTVIAGTGVTIDVYQNKLRIFEQGGSARGVYIDISAAGAGVSTNLLTGGTSGTGPDADTLDGYDSSYFLNYNNLLNKPTLFSGSYTDLTNKPTIPTVPSVLSAFTNDVGFITSYTETDPLYTASSWYNTTNNSSNWNTAYGWGNHASAGYLTPSSTIDWAQIVNEPVLFSGDYNDLTNKPTIPSLTGYATETYVNTQIANLVDSSPATLDTLNELAAALGDDPNFATSIATQLGNKANTADLATVATTGSYNDLVDKPSFKTINGNSIIGTGDITISGGSSYDQSLNTTNNVRFAQIKVGTVGQEVIVYNDGITIRGVPVAQENYVNAQLALKQNTLVSGTNIKTINGASILGSGNITITGGSGEGLYTNSVILSNSSSNQTIDSFDITQYRTVKYLIQVISGTDVESIEVNLMHTNVGILISQYNRMTSNIELGAFSAGIDSTTAYLRFSPVNEDTIIDLTRISIVARTLTPNNPLLILNDLETQSLPAIDLEIDSYPTTDLL